MIEHLSPNGIYYEVVVIFGKVQIVIPTRLANKILLELADLEDMKIELELED